MAEALNERLNKLIRERGISQRTLADLSGLTESSISHYVKGDRVPNSETITKIARALGSTPDYLLFGEPMSEDAKIDAAIDTIKQCARYLSFDQKIEIIESLIDEDTRNNKRKDRKND